MTALSATAAQVSDSINGQYYRLFTPMTFYHNVADRTLAINDEKSDKVADAVDAALLNVYLNRPDLVTTTETKLKEAGSVRADVDQPIETYTSFVQEAGVPEVVVQDTAEVELMIQ